MEYIETLLQSASYFGVIQKMMAMSTTDIAVLFLLSKPAFILTASVLVWTTRRKDDQALLADEDCAGVLSDR